MQSLRWMLAAMSLLSTLAIPMQAAAQTLHQIWINSRQRLCIQPLLAVPLPVTHCS
jgi:hypothetical protein